MFVLEAGLDTDVAHVNIARGVAMPRKILKLRRWSEGVKSQMKAYLDHRFASRLQVETACRLSYPFWLHKIIELLLEP